MSPSSAALNRAAFLLSCLGVFDSGVLTFAHLTEKVLPCGASSGCEVVATDSSSYLFGVPIAAFGLVCYCICLACAVLRGYGLNLRGLTIAGLAISGLGSLTGVGLTVHGKVDLGVYCPWCVASACLMVLLLIVHLLLLRTKDWMTRWGVTESLGAGLLVALALPGGIYFETVGAKERPMRLNLARLNVERPEGLAPANAHWRGSLNPGLTIVEFADLSCPACREMNFRLIRFLGHAKNVRLVFRHLPLSYLPGHSMSNYAALFAESAPNNLTFWKFVDAIYSLQAAPTKDQIRNTAIRLLGRSEPATGAQAAVQRADFHALVLHPGADLLGFVLLGECEGCEGD
ncbi:MAG TPA: vitamin K epoxide reductase family protein [Fimbriimonas sp.]|nr:vitamin K epoxide reductase family protein [Fimbriimonas sp.]